MFDQDKELSIVRIKPTLLRLFPSKLRKLGIHDCVKFTEMYIRRYVIYILMKGNLEIGYCVISRGGGGGIRYPFCSSNDLILGPYYLKSSERGQRLGAKLVSFVISDDYFGRNLDYFAFVNKANLPSIKSLESAGFTRVGDAEYTRFFRILKLNSDSSGSFFLYKKNNHEI